MDGELRHTEINHSVQDHTHSLQHSRELNQHLLSVSLTALIQDHPASLEAFLQNLHFFHNYPPLSSLPNFSYSYNYTQWCHLGRVGGMVLGKCPTLRFLQLLKVP